MAKKATIGDVARKAKVSLGTVSAVINQKDSVKQETRKKVLGAIKELNYRPSGSAQNLKNTGTATKTIGLLIRELDNPFYATIASSVSEYAHNKGYMVFVANSEGDHAFEEKITNSFSGKEIKGAIIAPVLKGSSEINHLLKLKMLNFPFVLLENVKGIQANVVSINNIIAMKTAMRYLIDNGHTRIIHFAGPRYAAHTYERIDGFRLAYLENRIPFSDDMIISTGARMEDGYKKCHEYFHGRDRRNFPTAILCYNDLVAIGVISALHELDLKIPDDISVIGNDDIPYAQRLPVQLTTIRAPMHRLGRTAAEILINNIESQEPLSIVNIEYDAEFVIRQSTKPLCKKRPEEKVEMLC